MSIASVRLRDGRAVAYEEYGDPAGFPVLNCHGGLLCRLDVEPAAGIAADLGLRIVSPDRPGVGGSDRHPDASTADWAADAEELLSALGIDRCAVMGWSAGGPVTIWQGDRDRLVPASWATMLLERLPAARLVTCPGEDHFIGLTRWPEVLRVLASTAP